jgi:EF-hand domain pair
MGYVSPMKGIDEENFIERIKEWMRIEAYIDSIREELIMYCEDFGPVQAFRIFVQKPDKNRNITQNNLKDAYDLLGVPLSNEESDLIMARIDGNKDGYLTYTDICDVFRPRNLALSREFGQRMPMELQTSSVISAKATKLIKKLFISLVKVENHI